MGSTANGHVGTDDGSPWKTVNPRCIKANPLPKPSDQHTDEFTKVMNSMQNVINSAEQCSNSEILESLMQAAPMMAKQNQSDYLMSDDGHTELLRRIEVRSEKPSSYLWRASTIQRAIA